MDFTSSSQICAQKRIRIDLIFDGFTENYWNKYSEVHLNARTAVEPGIKKNLPNSQINISTNHFCRMVLCDFNSGLHFLL